MQEFEGEGKLRIANASKKLLPLERNYSVIEKEFLAIEKFRNYLIGREFILECDYKPLDVYADCLGIRPEDRALGINAPTIQIKDCSVLCLLCLCARLFICALWSPAGKGLNSWLSFVVSTLSL